MEQMQINEYRLICFTAAGQKTMQAVVGGLLEDDDRHIETQSVSNLFEWTKANFKTGSILVYIGAAAIAVRAIAPLVEDKTTDPGVIVIDEAGRFVIPILSGHIGGANEAAEKIAQLIGAVAVVTTATDIREEFAVDVFARKHDLTINDMKLAKEFSARLLAGETAAFTVSPRVPKEGKLTLIPSCIVAGMGCKKGKTFNELYGFLKDALNKKYYDIRALKAIVSVDIKKDEPGFIELSEKLNIPFITYSADELMAQEGEFDRSDFTLEAAGTDNVCERALAAYGCQKIIMNKTAGTGMTIALGMKIE